MFQTVEACKVTHIPLAGGLADIRRMLGLKHCILRQRQLLHIRWCVEAVATRNIDKLAYRCLHATLKHIQKPTDVYISVGQYPGERIILPYLCCVMTDD